MLKVRNFVLNTKKIKGQTKKNLKMSVLFLLPVMNNISLVYHTVIRHIDR